MQKIAAGLIDRPLDDRPRLEFRSPGANPDTLPLWINVERDGLPWQCLALFVGDRPQLPPAACAVGTTVAVGYGEHIYFLDVSTRHLVTRPLDAYFGSLYDAAAVEAPEQSFAFLVGSASTLQRFDVAGNLLWESPRLGVDGVLVHEVTDGVVAGVGEWDPPDGWRPFRLSLADGRRLED